MCTMRPVFRRSVAFLTPSSRWAQVALLLLLLFTLTRSVLWASTQPAWLAPDEDYHSLYINYLAVEHSFPNLNGPFTTAEFTESEALTPIGPYQLGPVTSYSGNPHAILNEVKDASRKPVPPPPRPVLEAPLYYIGGAIVDRIFWSSPSITRLTLIRYYSAVLGMLTVFCAWLLAAQVLAREWQQLAAAAVASLQPILAFSSSTVTNDAGVALTLTATLAWCAWMLRAPPRARQGLGLGVLCAIALLTKTSLLALALVVPVVLAMLWKTYPEARRELVGVLRWAIAAVVVLAGWWYVYLLITTHSILGEEGHVTATAGAQGPGLSGLWPILHIWFLMVYRNYWFTYLFSQVPPYGTLFWLPIIGIGAVASAVLVYLIRSRGQTFAPAGVSRRVTIVILWTAVVFLLPPLLLDTWRGIHGLVFSTAQGRFLTPVYPALAVVAVVAIGDVTRFVRHGYAVATGALVACAFLLYCTIWWRWGIEGLYGFSDGHFLRVLERVPYYKPPWVTTASLGVMIGVALLAFIAGFVVAVVGAIRTRAVGDLQPVRLATVDEPMK